MTTKRGSFALWVSLSAGLWLLIARPAISAESASLLLEVTIIAAPPCVINKEQPIEVDFGSGVMTSRVDGTYALRDVEYGLECNAASSNAIKMQIKGDVANGGRGLHTNNENLAIALLKDGVDVPVNSWINFTWPNKPKLQAVPIKIGKGVLAGGLFSTGATMIVDYQ